MDCPACPNYRANLMNTLLFNPDPNNLLMLTARYGYRPARYTLQKLKITDYSNVWSKLLPFVISDGAIDSNGNFFATGVYMDDFQGSYEQLHYVKVGSDGTIQYSKVFGDAAYPGRMSFDIGLITGNGIAVDNTNSYFYIVGDFRSGDIGVDGYFTVGVRDQIVLQFDIATGTRQSFEAVYGLAGMTCSWSKIAIDNNNNLILLGTADGTWQGLTYQGAIDITLQKMTPTGTILFSKLIGGLGEETPISVQVDSQGNIYVFANTKSDTTATSDWNILVDKYTANGVNIYSRILGGTGDDYVYSAYLDESKDSIFIVGSTNSPSYYGNTATPDGCSSFLVLSMSVFLFSNLLCNTI